MIEGVEMNEEKMNDILADAIEGGKSTMGYAAAVFAIANAVGSLNDLADVCEEMADTAQDAGIIIREMALAVRTLGVENLDEDSGKD